MGIPSPRLAAIRTHNGDRFYGYLFGDDPLIYWSRRFYEECWHPPIIVDI